MYFTLKFTFLNVLLRLRPTLLIRLLNDPVFGLCNSQCFD